MIKAYYRHSREKLTVSTFLRMVMANFKKRKILMSSLAILLLVILPILTMVLSSKSNVQAAWMDDTWLFRKAITIPSHTALETNVYVTVPTFDATDTTKFQVDCGDLRFTKQNGERLPYYVVDCDATAIIHVQFDSLPAGASTYYMYYGNASAQNGFSSTDFSTAATGLGSQALAAEEKSAGPVAYWKLNEGYGDVANNSTWRKTGTVTNLLPNPSFETNTTGWIRAGGSTGSLSRITSDKFFGAASGSVVGATDYAWSRARYNGIVVAPSTTYTLSAYVKAGSAGAVGKTLLLGLIGDSSGESTSGTTLTSDWKRVSFQKTTNVSDTTFAAEVIWSNNVAGDTFYFDAVQLEASSTTDIYCDGSLTGNGSHMWTGTANASSSICDSGMEGQIYGPTWQTEDRCINGKCLYFNGTNNRIDSNTKLDSITTELSVGGWVKPINPPNVVGRIIATTYDWDVTPSLQRGWTLGLNYGSTDVLQMYLFDSSGNSSSVSVNNFFSTYKNTWVHVVGTYKAGEYVRIYINGKLAAESTSSIISAIAPGSTNFRIGSRSDTISQGMWDGYMDEIKIYSYARTEAQIKSDFTSKGSGSIKGTSVSMGSNPKNASVLSNGLVGYWKMNEASWTADCTTGSVLDASGNGNNGSACPNSTGPTGATNGKFGNGGFFDGSDDYVSIGGSTVYATKNAPFSASAWANLTDFSTSNYPVLVRLMSDDTQPWFIILSNQTNYLGIAIGNSGSFKTIKTNTPTTDLTGAWHHITTTYNGKDSTDINNFKIYLDGQLQVNSAAGAFSSFSQASSISYGGSGNRWYGSIDEVRVYNRILSPNEVLSLYTFAPMPLVNYNFEEGGGSTVNDTSGNSVVGTWNGTGSHWAQGKMGKAGNFDGSSDYILAQSSTFALSNALTLAAWINPTSASGTHNIITNYDIYDYRIYQSGTNLGIQISLDDGNTGYHTATGVLTTNTWQYVAGVFDGSTVKLYVNNKLVLSEAAIGAIITPENGISIGACGVAACEIFQGQIDDVKIYNYARTSGQIIEDMNGGHPLGGSPIGSQIGYWKFDEGYGDIAYDSSPSQINGDLSGSGGVCPGAAGCPSWNNSGKLNKALDFDGTNDYVEIVDNPTFDVTDTDDITISGWFNRDTAGNEDTIIAKRNSLAAVDVGWVVTIRDSDVLDFQLSDGADEYQMTTTQTFATTGWNFFTIVWDQNSSSNSKIYINGIQVPITTAGTIGNIGDTSNALSLRIGTQSDGSERFDGKMDEIKIYNAALTPDEVKLDYNRGSAMVLGVLSGGSTASNSASSSYCVPGDTSVCSSPIGEWKFEESSYINNCSTSTVFDSSTNGLSLLSCPNGTGPTTKTVGKIGSAAYFDGVNDELSSTSTSFNLTGEITTQAWVKITNITNTSDPEILNKSNNNAGYALEIGYSGRNPKFRIGNGTTYSVLSGTSVLQNNVWYFITGTLSADGTQKIYVNGREESSTTITGTLAAAVGQSFRLGVRGAGTYLNGVIDEVRIYDYARTPSQIAWDYNKGKPIGWWKMDECQGLVANDSSVTNNPGTVSIGATGTNTTAGTCTGSTGEAWKDGSIGKFNSSLEFDGTDDYAYTADSPSLDVGTMTVSAWIKTTNASEQCIVERNNSTFYFCTNSGKLRYWINGVGATWTTSNKSINDNVWHHVMATWNGSDKKLYIDGVLDSTESGSGGNIANASSGLNIGVRINSGTPQNYFQGQIDDIRLYGYPLTPQQIKQVYTNGAMNFGPTSGTP